VLSPIATLEAVQYHGRFAAELMLTSMAGFPNIVPQCFFHHLNVCAAQHSGAHSRNLQQPATDRYLVEEEMPDFMYVSVCIHANYALPNCPAWSKQGAILCSSPLLSEKWHLIAGLQYLSTLRHCLLLLLHPRIHCSLAHPPPPRHQVSTRALNCTAKYFTGSIYVFYLVTQYCQEHVEAHREDARCHACSRSIHIFTKVVCRDIKWQHRTIACSRLCWPVSATHLCIQGALQQHPDVTLAICTAVHAFCSATVLHPCHFSPQGKSASVEFLVCQYT